MDTVDDVVRYVSHILNDQDEVAGAYSTWPYALLLSSFKEAAALIASRLPSAFREDAELLLQPGMLQNIPTEYRQNFRLLGQRCQRNGVSYVKTDVIQVQKLIRSNAACCDVDGMFVDAARKDECGGYTLQAWSMDSADPSHFTVQPDVPFGAQATVVVSYANTTALNAPVDMRKHAAFVPLIVSWMLYRAYSTDLKTDDVRLRAEQHRNSFDTDIKNLAAVFNASRTVEVLT